MIDTKFIELFAFMNKIPAVHNSINSGTYDNGNWWLKFSIDIKHHLAWNIVQEFGHILNYVSLDEKLPTIFYPVSAPPYMNGGPVDFLYWIIESKDPDFSPADLKEWLESILPNPVNDLTEWEID